MAKYKPKEIKISKVFHLAADKYLKTCHEEDSGRYQYSCSAIRMALIDILKIQTNTYYAFHFKLNYYLKIIEKGLINMGLTKPDSITYFRKFERCREPTEESQGARYMWLKFCAFMAEEQGE